MSGKLQDPLEIGDEILLVNALVGKDATESSHEREVYDVSTFETALNVDDRETYHNDELSAKENDEDREVNSVASNGSDYLLRGEHVSQTEGTHADIPAFATELEHDFHSDDLIQEKTKEDDHEERTDYQEKYSQYKGNSIDAIKDILSKYADMTSDFKRQRSNDVSSLDTIESSSLNDEFFFENIKRPSLNLLNFLPSDEASDPFLHVIEEADEEADYMSTGESIDTTEVFGQEREEEEKATDDNMKETSHTTTVYEDNAIKVDVADDAYPEDASVLEDQEEEDQDAVETRQAVADNHIVSDIATEPLLNYEESVVTSVKADDADDAYPEDASVLEDQEEEDQDAVETRQAVTDNHVVSDVATEPLLVHEEFVFTSVNADDASILEDQEEEDQDAVETRQAVADNHIVSDVATEPLLVHEESMLMSVKADAADNAYPEDASILEDQEEEDQDAVETRQAHVSDVATEPLVDDEEPLFTSVKADNADDAYPEDASVLKDQEEEDQDAVETRQAVADNHIVSDVATEPLLVHEESMLMSVKADDADNAFPEDASILEDQEEEDQDAVETRQAHVSDVATEPLVDDEEPLFTSVKADNADDAYPEDASVLKDQEEEDQDAVETRQAVADNHIVSDIATEPLFDEEEPLFASVKADDADDAYPEDASVLKDQEEEDQDVVETRQAVADNLVSDVTIEPLVDDEEPLFASFKVDDTGDAGDTYPEDASVLKDQEEEDQDAVETRQAVADNLVSDVATEPLLDDEEPLLTSVKADDTDDAYPEDASVLKDQEEEDQDAVEKDILDAYVPSSDVNQIGHTLRISDDTISSYEDKNHFTTEYQDNVLTLINVDVTDDTRPDTEGCAVEDHSEDSFTGAGQTTIKSDFDLDTFTKPTVDNDKRLAHDIKEDTGADSYLDYYCAFECEDALYRPIEESRRSPVEDYEVNMTLINSKIDGNVDVQDTRAFEMDDAADHAITETRQNASYVNHSDFMPFSNTNEQCASEGDADSSEFLEEEKEFDHQSQTSFEMEPSEVATTERSNDLYKTVSIYNDEFLASIKADIAADVHLYDVSMHEDERGFKHTPAEIGLDKENEADDDTTVDDANLQEGQEEDAFDHATEKIHQTSTDILSPSDAEGHNMSSVDPLGISSGSRLMESIVDQPKQSSTDAYGSSGSIEAGSDADAYHYHERMLEDRDVFETNEFLRSNEADFSASAHLHDEGFFNEQEDQARNNRSIRHVQNTTVKGDSGHSSKENAQKSEKSSLDYERTLKVNNLKGFGVIRSIFSRRFRRGYNPAYNAAEDESKSNHNVCDAQDDLIKNNATGNDCIVSSSSEDKWRSNDTDILHVDDTRSPQSVDPLSSSAAPGENVHFSSRLVTKENSSSDIKQETRIPSDTTTTDNQSIGTVQEKYSQTSSRNDAHLMQDKVDLGFSVNVDKMPIDQNRTTGIVSRDTFDIDDENSFYDHEKHDRFAKSPVMPSSSSLSTISTASQGKNSLEFEILPHSLVKSKVIHQDTEVIHQEKSHFVSKNHRSLNAPTLMSDKKIKRASSVPRSARSSTSEDQSVYERLYSLAKDRNSFHVTSKGVTDELKRNSRDIFRSASAPRRRTDSVGHGRLSYTLTDLTEKRRNAELKKKAFLEKHSVSSPERKRATGLLSTQERLYNLAKKKREIEEQRQKRKEKELEEKNKPKGLVLESKRSFTPRKSRGDNVHLRLYSLAQGKTDRNENPSETTESNKKSSVRSLVQCNASVTRLYSRSLKMQEEGFERRKMIEMKNQKLNTPTGKITIDRAAALYERGMMKKIALEMKREEEGILPYVSPLLNPLLAMDDYDYSHASMDSPRGRPSSAVNSRPRSSVNSVSSARSVSNIRDRSSTPSSRIARSDSFSSAQMSPNLNVKGEPKRVRSRSRLRSSTPTMFSFRSPSPAYDSSQRSITRAPSAGSRSRYATPQRAALRNSTKQLLRQMEEDVDLYKKVKTVLLTKEGKDDGFVSDSSGSRSMNHRQMSNLSSFPPLPRPKKQSSVSGAAIADKFDSQSSNRTCQTGILTLASYDSSEKCEEECSNTLGRFLVRPRSVDYCE